MVVVSLDRYSVRFIFVIDVAMVMQVAFNIELC